MVTFLTLFLGLFVGTREVALAVREGVTAVELRLDGATVARLTSPPWRTTVPFGEELAPHDLVAIGYDAQGKELSRARQRINRPRSEAEAALSLEKGEGGRTWARLTWSSIVAENPLKVSVTFDGKPLPVADPRRFPLPGYVPEQLHFLRAELDFESNVVAVAELTFGGHYKDETQAELTALAVVLTKGKRLPQAEGLAGWFSTEGQPLKPVAVEEGPAEVVFVLDESARRPLEILRLQEMTRRVGPYSIDPELRFSAAFRRDQRFRFLWPVAIRKQHSGETYELFPRTEDFTKEDGGLIYLLSHVQRPAGPEAAQRLADAVAVGGLSATDRDRRRAVVLILGPRAEDESHGSVEQARRYLARLGVPMQVWCVGAEAVPAAAPWGGCAEVSRLDALERTLSALSRELDRQRIVWVAGIHLPSRIELAPQADSITLAR